MTAAVILAAGAGTRLGGVAKALLETPRGDSFVEAVKHTAEAAGVRRFVVVVGPPYGIDVEREARRLGLAVVVNPYPERGMASSIEVGFGHARLVFARDNHALLWPVDHPAVTPDTVAAVLAQASARNVVIPMYEGRGGHPTAFGRELWDRLATCSAAPRGARSVIRQLEAASPDRICRIAVADPGVRRDVDTPADHAGHTSRERAG